MVAAYPGDVPWPRPLPAFGGYVAHHTSAMVLWPPSAGPRRGDTTRNVRRAQLGDSGRHLEARRLRLHVRSYPRGTAHEDSGTVVIGRGAGKDADVFGDAPNVAARVQSVASTPTEVC